MVLANLRRLVALRWFILAGFLGLLLLAKASVEFIAADGMAWFALASYALVNLSVQLHLRGLKQCGEDYLVLNLVGDLILIYWFMMASGGAANPFTLLFLVPVIVAAATLRAFSIWAITFLAILAYSGLLLQSPAGQANHAGHAEASRFDLHLIGMWLGLVMVALLVAYFVTWMNTALRERERELAQARERQLRDERVIALGALAAGAAHELGTPLSTMAVVNGEMHRKLGGQIPAHLDSDLKLLREQIERCKSVLRGLSRYGKDLQAEGGTGMPVQAMLQRVISDWKGFRPGREVDFHYTSEHEGPLIVADETLAQAIASLLNNAADASDQTIRFQADCDPKRLGFAISDGGRGIEPEIRERLGRDVFDSPSISPEFTPAVGMGIGLLLAVSTIERLGGQVEFLDGDQGGAEVRVELPLERLQVRLEGALA